MPALCGEMIFDSITAKQLYINYVDTDDNIALEKLHVLANDLIKVIAMSLNRDDYYEDLVQEGHLKLHKILRQHQFRIDTHAAMYTFLSKVLRNHMIDYLRKCKPCVDIESVTHLQASDNYIICDTDYVDELFDHYYPQRFPTLKHGYDHASYVYEAVQESITRNKIINTLTLNPNLLRSQALAIYRSVNAFLGITSVLSITPAHLSNSLLHAHNSNEFTLYPECIMAECDSVMNYNALIAHVSNLKATLRGKTT